MALVDRTLYNDSDIHAYFTGVAAEYDGEVHVVHEASSGRVFLSGRGWVAFSDEKLHFPHPKVGVIQMGDTVEILHKEPYRQWKKGFRLRECPTIRIMEGLASEMTEMDRIRCAVLDKDYTFNEAYTAVFNGDALAHKINRSFYLAVGFNGRFIELFHRSNTEVAIGLADDTGVRLYAGAAMFVEQIEKMGVAIHD